MKLSNLSAGVALGIIIAFSTNALAKNFPDVNASDWFYDYVQKIEQWGIISGNDDGTFAPEREVVRAELSKMFVLLDERTDEKIDESQASMQLKINESLKALETEVTEEEAVEVETETEVAEKMTLPTTMVLRKRNNPPATCPSDWTELDSGYAGSDNFRLNQRTCLTKQRCEVLNLTKHTNNPPAACPTGWSEASYGQVQEQDMERVCYICES
ncbi:S-layer homology domain-containing protein [Candidatus Peregrinibacteria bacterium]|nr:S-layer homology domain-containing protein [bacterium]NCQ55815.1 S-layer homology domain-containing protein [Candidatus Parcubacteria bacterium]NCS67882.1 S-layer homology domain-containing protein [Candidatus Peregrinibacteria bacterium]